MVERFDPTPLPPPLAPVRPPTVEVRQQRKRARLVRWGFVRLVFALSLVLAVTALLLSLEAYDALRDQLAVSRDEAAALRRALFRAQDDLVKLKQPKP